MKKIIHHLRKLSEEKRRYILQFCTIIFAVILIMIWIYSLGNNFSNPDTQIKMKEDLKQFDSLKDNMIDGYNSLQ